MENVFIYALIDPRNDHVRYIGKANNPKDRYKNHFNSTRDKNTHKRNWINSVRKDGLRPELVIIDEVPESEWIYWEKFYISLFKTWGFNLVNYTEGGDGSTFGNSGSWKKGNIPHNKGIPCSDFTKKKIKDKLTGISNVNSYKPIIQYDLNYIMIKRYKCIKDAVDESNGFFSSGKISSCCLGKRKHHREFIWKYDNGVEIDKKKFKLLKKPVIQYDNNLMELKRYSSIKEASKETGVCNTNITFCCKGKSLTAGGFIWKYVDGDDFSTRKNKQKKSVIQYGKDLTEINEFESITEACQKTGVKINSIWSCCKGINETGGGFIWKYKKIENNEKI